MKISIITVCYNAEDTISDTIQSVLSQDYEDVEYIIVDGKSTDRTLEIIQTIKNGIQLISEKDRGIYDAMNKGINIATGDVIGILNADDVYKNNQVLTNVMNAFRDNVSVVYGDIEYVKFNDVSKVVRKWKAGVFRPGKFKWGWMPPHPGFFMKKSCYDSYGLFNLNLSTSADYELMLRMLEVHNLNHIYISKTITSMRVGGAVIHP
ncbi:MAG: glycosyl transferase [Crocinitomicaceae bacterium]|nr:MAG: glycosyl transferase [Crocinitomicaceae bacterium]